MPIGTAGAYFCPNSVFLNQKDAKKYKIFHDCELLPHWKTGFNPFWFRPRTPAPFPQNFCPTPLAHVRLEFVRTIPGYGPYVVRAVSRTIANPEHIPFIRYLHVNMEGCGCNYGFGFARSFSVGGGFFHINSIVHTPFLNL